MGNYSLPSFDELVLSAEKDTKVQRTSVKKTCSVIRPTVTAAKVRAAAYCRVSTDKEDQKSSIYIQKTHFASVADKHDDWEFVGIYADVVSGTKKEKRPELKRLLSDCAAGDINLVMTKSVSRFARNTTDLLEMVRTLTANGTDIYFERENIDTRTMDSEFLLTILASLAEEESRSIAANCRWGIQKRFENGTYRASSAPFGYDLQDGTYVVNEKEAAVVREVFSAATSGTSFREIAESLNDRGIPTKRAGEYWKGKQVSGKWSATHIWAMLKNEAYIGTQILQKTYAGESFQRMSNKGKYPLCIHKDHHPAIIDEATFAAVQGILKERSTGPAVRNEPHVFSGKLICGYCGERLIRVTSRTGAITWACRRHRKRAADCNLPHIPQDSLEDAFDKTWKDLSQDDTPVQEYRVSVLAICREQNHFKFTRLETEKLRIESELMSLERSRNRIGDTEYLSRKNQLLTMQAEVTDELLRLTDNKIEMIKELLKAIHSLSSSSFSFIDYVTVNGRDDYTFHFNCGFDFRFGGKV